ncbi:hypothetical protein CIK06_24035 [Plantactinospora sp. KBS50]|nr:hypothetical protein CIK06_24035 [Plantactinospora sp. KBS50]
MATDVEILPTPLRWAVRLLRVEAVGLGLLAAFLVWSDFTATVVDLTSAIIVTAFAAGGALLLWLLGGALTARRAAARAPAIVLQLMLFPVGYYMTRGGLGWVGVPLIALGAAVCGLLVSGPSTRALGAR